MRRYTGDFTITLGNTTWKPNGVYFDSPNPDGAEHFGNDQHALSQLQKDTLPKTASSRPTENPELSQPTARAAIMPPGPAAFSKT
jgi:hypothetical protein